MFWASLACLFLHTSALGVQEPTTHGAECSTETSRDPVSHDYGGVFSLSREHAAVFADLPGFTRSVYQRDHAVLTPESRVWSSQPGWVADKKAQTRVKATTAHIVSKATGANFAMYIAKMQAGSVGGDPAGEVERFLLVLDGAVNISVPERQHLQELHADGFAYFPAGLRHKITSTSGAGLLVYERVYSLSHVKGIDPPQLHVGAASAQPLLPVPGEVFDLRKMLPQTEQYDFNVHVMDFRPGEYLNVKESHYNQHGLLLLTGQGIYRLADNWYPVQAGDAIWMAPYVLQWYAALGTINSRYVIYKDTTNDPLL